LGLKGITCGDPKGGGFQQNPYALLRWFFYSPKPSSKLGRFAAKFFFGLPAVIHKGGAFSKTLRDAQLVFHFPKACNKFGITSGDPQRGSFQQNPSRCSVGFSFPQSLQASLGFGEMKNPDVSHRGFAERETGFEPATPTLARSCSTS